MFRLVGGRGSSSALMTTEPALPLASDIDGELGGDVLGFAQVAQTVFSVSLR